MSETTKKHRKRTLALVVVSWVLCFGMAIGLLAIGANKFVGREQETIIEMTGTMGDQAQAYIEKAKTLIVTSFASLIPMLVLSIIVKDKIRPLVWMINILLSSVLLGSGVMYGVFAIWFVDEYILRALAKNSRAKWVINKEIDLRE